MTSTRTLGLGAGAGLLVCGLHPEIAGPRAEVVLGLVSTQWRMRQGIGSPSGAHPLIGGAGSWILHLQDWDTGPGVHLLVGEARSWG